MSNDQYESDKRHAILSGMADEASRRYADRMQHHPSRGGSPVLMALDRASAVAALDTWAAAHELGTVHLHSRRNMSTAESVFQVVLTARDSLDLESGWFATADEARAALALAIYPGRRRVTTPSTPPDPGLTLEKRAELRRLAEAATPGEWRAGVNDTDCVFGDVNNPALMAPYFGRVLLRTNRHFPAFEADARFVGAANPATVLSLLDALDSRDRELERAVTKEQALAAVVDELGEAWGQGYEAGKRDQFNSALHAQYADEGEPETTPNPYLEQPR